MITQSRTFEPVRLHGEAQLLTDQVIDALGVKKLLNRHPAYAALTELLDEDGAGDMLNELICGERNILYSPTLADVCSHAYGMFEGTDTHEEILTALRRTLQEALQGEPGFWGEEPTLTIVGTITHTEGRKALIVFQMDMLCGPYEWLGVYPDWATLQARLKRKGSLLSMEEYDAIPREEILKVWEMNYSLTAGKPRQVPLLEQDDQ